jgi:hypothetical protein
MELDPSFELGPKVLEFKKNSRIGIEKYIYGEPSHKMYKCQNNESRSS